MWENIALGFSVALSPGSVFYAFLGCLLGTLIGVLPGLGPVATISILLPITYGMEPVHALIMLAGIYYGAQYGGSTTSILLRLPGEAASVVTCLDGYEMTRQGRGGVALAIAALASFLAGCFGTLVIALFGPVLAGLAIQFGAVENFALMLCGLLLAVLMARGSALKALSMAALGIMLGLVGIDINSGTERFTLGWPHLGDGLEIAALALGLFGIAEIIANLEQKEERRFLAGAVSSLIPSVKDLLKSLKPALRGTALGSLIGLLPGSHATLASFSSYTLERRIATDPSRFGRGAIEGVAGPEAANNAAAQTYFIPMLTLGIPTGTVMALMLSAMMIQGIAPGPEVMTTRPELFWGLIASMWVGNLMLVILNLPLVGIWVKLLQIPYKYLYPAIVAFCCIGIYSINNSVVDVFFVACLAAGGYVLAKFEFELAPLLLGFVLGPMMEENFRRALVISRGDYSVFYQSWISSIIFGIMLVSIILVVTKSWRLSKVELAADVKH